MSQTGETLYEKIGGEEAVERLIDSFYEKVLSDQDLKPFFEKTSMEKLRSMQREFFGAALGGPITYTGRPLGHVHAGRGITKKHFARFVEHLLETLKQFDFSEKEIYGIISRIDLYADEITGETSLDS